jgi:hypothetical protein
MVNELTAGRVYDPLNNPRSDGLGNFGDIPPATPKSTEVLKDRKLSAQERFNDDVREVIEEIAALLEEKNRKYGDSALNPSRIFARSDAVEQIKVRMDDKLNRIKNAQDDENEDVILDLLGYLIILRIAQKRNGSN